MRNYIKNIILETLIEYRRVVKDEQKEPVFDLKEQALSIQKELADLTVKIYKVFDNINEKLDGLDIEKLIREEIRAKLTDYFKEDYQKKVQESEKKGKSKTIKDKIEKKKKK